MKTIKLKISKMSCAACSASIERSLKRKDFIKSIEVDLISECANVAFDESRIDSQGIIALIEKLGYGAEIFTNRTQSKAQNNDYLIAIIFAIPLFCVSMGAMIWGDSPIFSDFIATNQALICAIEIALLVPILYAGRKIYAKGFNALFRLVPNMDSLVFLGSFSAIAFSAYMALRLGFESPHLLHNLYFESAGVIIAVIMLGKRLENIATSNAKRGIESLINLSPKTALKVLENGEILEVRVESLQIGDIVVVPKGAAFGVDCELVSESCEIDESVITGESRHKHRMQGAFIYSGSVNCGEQIRAKVKNLAQDSMISKIIALAQNVKKAPIARIADSISAYFVPSVICVALCAGIAWDVASGDFHKAFIVFSSTLLISCPCALGLATPLSILVATSIASKRGFYFRNAESLEVAAKITTMIFDKTGTLTSGDLRVVEWVDLRESSVDCHDSAFAESRNDNIFALIYALESQSEHLIAKAILRHIRESSANLGVDLSANPNIAKVQTIAGQGISAIIDGKKVAIGSADFVGESCAIDSRVLEKSAQIPHTTCFVSIDSQCVGFFIIADNLRPNAKNLIANLRAQGIKSVILSGDNEKSVQSVAQLCEIDEFYFAQLPQDKLDFITRAQERSEIVGFVGDGINDALAITRANIGVALNSSSDIAIKQSDIILLNGNLGSVEKALALSKKTIRNIKENLGFAFLYNVCAIPLAVGIPHIFGVNFALTPMIAGIAMGLSSISVVLNALRLYKF